MFPLICLLEKSGAGGLGTAAGTGFGISADESYLSPQDVEGFGKNTFGETAIASKKFAVFLP